MYVCKTTYVCRDVGPDERETHTQGNQNQSTLCMVVSLQIVNRQYLEHVPNGTFLAKNNNRSTSCSNTGCRKKYYICVSLQHEKMNSINRYQTIYEDPTDWLNEKSSFNKMCICIGDQRKTTIHIINYHDLHQ